MAFTQNQIARIWDAIGECGRQIQREERYSPEFRDHASIAFHEAHILKLTKALETGVLPTA